jgi:hypothetical protein
MFVRTKTVRLMLLGAALLLLPQTARADLRLLKPSPTDAATFVGRGGYSADGLGQNGTGGNVQADVPAGSTVVQAYLYASYFFTPTPIPAADLTIDFDGTVVTLGELTNAAPGPCCSLRSARADVTAQVAAKVGGGGGLTDFAVNTDPPTLDGVALVVIYSNPLLPDTTIAILDGGAEQTGDSATFVFAAPLDKTIPGFSATMTLGIGFGFQTSDGGHTCGGIQFSTIDVNGSRLTSCAGNYDDGLGNNGALFTVGGVGDSILNPIDPNVTAGDDDELYNIEPFVSQGDADLVITTTNPSGDDIVFLSVISITARAVVTTEICGDGIDNDRDGLVDSADPDCAPPPVSESGRMTGGGRIAGSVTSHGMNLSCDPQDRRSQLQVNWGKNRFHMTELTGAFCSDAGGIEPGQPLAQFDTITGTGTGRYNNKPGSVTFTFTDAGEPGKSDTATIEVKDENGTVVLSVTGLVQGNQQAH